MSKKREARLETIVGMLAEEKQLDVSELSQKLNVSQVTIRKDLDELEAKGFIQRIHGYAKLHTSDHLTSRLAYHYEEKKRIAQKAASLIHDGDTIMIESGSCCAILADLLASQLNSLTIITNSAFIAGYIRSHKNIQVILVGGMYQHDSQCLVGPMVRESISSFHVQNFFIGTDGFSAQTLFTNKDPLRAQAVSDMADICERVIVLTESEKFNQVGTLPLRIDKPITVITDHQISPQAIQDLKEHDIELILAP